MGKFKFVYCNNCEEFRFYASLNWKMCNNCKQFSIVVLYADSFAEMANIERAYKIKKITKNI